ncbi:hypothetical protein AXK11_01500 [Cephaloticoccus primus]|uniref:Helix-turn-helix domain-containing protein n=1 Tax=Cephaloticoccus primus TaxID=1548207 RepID=A0A139STF4_9BACT|nr:helix-turn-helix domain-containing protein [Cephaloticoccus primus]KXU37856.1 hypothetical protein AXK11_01500 [Cephaloticoccus primus]
MTNNNLLPEKAVFNRSNPSVNMTLKEAASYVACSPRKLRDLVLTRRVKHARVGSKIVIRREWLDAFLEKGGAR